MIQTGRLPRQAAGGATLSDSIMLSVPEALLRDWVTETYADGRSSALTAQLRKYAESALAEADAKATDLHRRESQAADQLLPLLQLAQQQGTYVRSAFVGFCDPALIGFRPFVYPNDHWDTNCQNFFWAGAQRELARRGVRVQMVMWSHERGSDVQGYRLAPGEDDKTFVELTDVYRQAGRCLRCGITPEQAEVQQICHFPEHLHTWPTQASSGKASQTERA
jgi:hypothetical protein